MPTTNPRLLLGATLFTTPGMKAGGSHFPGVLSLVIMVALLLVLIRFALYHLGSKPNPPDADPGDGWGKRPQPPSDRPRDPNGGIPIPLDSSVQSRVRLRGRRRLNQMRPARSRRLAPEPGRGPARRRTPA